MEKNYIIKSVVPKAWTDWKVLGYSINFHHKNFPDNISSLFYSVDDMKTLFNIQNESQANWLVWQSCWLKKELVIK